MSASLQTTNYKLPYFGENDNTDWSAYNESMQKIDTQLFANAGSAASASEQISAVQSNVLTLSNTVQTQGNKISNLETNISTAQSNINLINQTDLEQNQKISQLQSEIQNISAKTIYTPNVNAIAITPDSQYTAQAFTVNYAYYENGYVPNPNASAQDGYDLTIFLRAGVNGTPGTGDKKMFYIQLTNQFKGKSLTLYTANATVNRVLYEGNPTSSASDMVELGLSSVITESHGYVTLIVYDKGLSSIASSVTSWNMYATLKLGIGIPKQ